MASYRIRLKIGNNPVANPSAVEAAGAGACAFIQLVGSNVTVDDPLVKIRGSQTNKITIRVIPVNTVADMDLSLIKVLRCWCKSRPGSAERTAVSTHSTSQD